MECIFQQKEKGRLDLVGFHKLFAFFYRNQIGSLVVLEGCSALLLFVYNDALFVYNTVGKFVCNSDLNNNFLLLVTIIQEVYSLIN